jgi:UDP-N-acetylmuramoyl-tripeptide--D-alanyl-D-alanine ligase
VAPALAKGAAAAMVARVPSAVPSGAPLLIVNDTQAALEALGRAARTRARARVAAVTGSVGKTSTKEALRLALDADHPDRPTHASIASFNNAIGVPLTLARMPADSQHAVFEIGMNHAGEMTPLVRMVRPEVAIVTNVEGVHTENFPDGIQGVAAAKAEIFDGFENGGAAVLNRDNRFFEFLAERARQRGAHVTSFGTAEGADIRLVEFRADGMESDVVASVHGTTLAYRLAAPGRHWALNSLAVLAAAEALGVAPPVAAAGLARVAPAKGRGQRHRLKLADGTYELIDDSYNASPASMRASFEVLKAAAPGAGGRRIAVLGDMLELGPQAPELHAGLAQPLMAAGVDLVFTCGPNMARLHDALPSRLRGGHAPASDTLLPLVRAALRPGDVVVVKGSLGSRMGRIVEALLAGPSTNGNGDGTRPMGRVANG